MTASEVAELDPPPAPPSGAAGSMVQDQGRHSKRNGGMTPQPKGVDPAFEIWLNRGLHQLYDAVAKEPLPQELLKLIEEDRFAKK